MVFYKRTVSEYTEQKIRLGCGQRAELSSTGGEFYPGHGTTTCCVSFDMCSPARFGVAFFWLSFPLLSPPPALVGSLFQLQFCSKRTRTSRKNISRAKKTTTRRISVSPWHVWIGSVALTGLPRGLTGDLPRSKIHHIGISCITGIVNDYSCERLWQKKWQILCFWKGKKTKLNKIYCS